MSRIILFQYSDCGAREDLELSDDGIDLYLIEMSDLTGKWVEAERTRLATEVLTEGVKLGGIAAGIEKKAQKRWRKALFRLVKKVDEGDITMTEFKKAIKYKPERHKYPKGQPRLKGE